jgi:uncharacterized protein with HEPN domain
MTDDRLNIAYIAECIRKIQLYTQSGKSAFWQDSLIQDGVVRNFEVIGEATKNLSIQIKSTYPDIPWRKMAGLRDVLSHNYIGIDLKIVWDIVEQDLPDLKQKIDAIAQDLGAL